MSSKRNKLLYLITEFVLISLLIFALTLNKERRVDPSAVVRLSIGQQISPHGG